MTTIQIISVPAGLVFAPFLLGVINRTKAFFAGRNGPPICQAYYDLFKLLKKGAVYSRTTTMVFRAAPSINLAAVMCALVLVPVYGSAAPVSFSGDLILFAYSLGLMRFFTVAAALDTGSSFEGMGASREVQFSALAEPALIMALAALARLSDSLSLTGAYAGVHGSSWLSAGPALGLVCVALLIVFLAENSRIPVDDPNTHLELTMIHEVMILDYSGPDLAFVLYGASLKIWVLGALIVNTALSFLSLDSTSAFAVFLLGMIILAVIVGVIESAMARLSLLKVPHLLIGAMMFAVLAFTLVVRSTL